MEPLFQIRVSACRNAVRIRRKLQLPRVDSECGPPANIVLTVDYAALSPAHRIHDARINCIAVRGSGTGIRENICLNLRRGYRNNVTAPDWLSARADITDCPSARIDDRPWIRRGRLRAAVIGNKEFEARGAFG